MMLKSLPAFRRTSRCATTSSTRHRELGDDDHVGATREAAHHRDPSRVASHDLADHDAVVRRRGGVQAVERLGDHAHGAVETDAVVGDAQVVVHRLGHTDHGACSSASRAATLERVIAADGDERVEPQPFHVAHHVRDAAVDLHRVHARAAEHRAAELQDAREPRTLEAEDVAVAEQPAHPLRIAEQRVAGGERAPADGADRRVEARCVTPAGQDRDSHATLLVCCVLWRS